MDLDMLGGIYHPLDHYWGLQASTLWHLVAPQNYGGLTIVLDRV